eukprot:TRINITY_DN359_c0_g1_i1.p2 TRINITY_DN359_c0_g1~~TRINITY_DN359_c0_g1_i1.p2  ORF type:complete len:199 (-),score=1.46 TRINITY_DN359_c0_g1_i1:256-852(-)
MDTRHNPKIIALGTDSSMYPFKIPNIVQHAAEALIAYDTCTGSRQQEYSLHILYQFGVGRRNHTIFWRVVKVVEMLNDIASIPTARSPLSVSGITNSKITIYPAINAHTAVESKIPTTLLYLYIIKMVRNMRFAGTPMIPVIKQLKLTDKVWDQGNNIRLADEVNKVTSAGQNEEYEHKLTYIFSLFSLAQLYHIEHR